jgi:hypothetical protein
MLCFLMGEVKMCLEIHDATIMYAPLGNQSIFIKWNHNESVKERVDGFADSVVPEICVYN